MSIVTTNQNATGIFVDEPIIIGAEYGVVGDGVADDTAAINAAISKGFTEQRKVIFPGYLTYRVTDTIVLSKGVTNKTHHIVFEGSKENISSSSPSGSILWDGGNDSMAFYIEHQGASKYCVLEGISLINLDAATNDNMIGMLWHDPDFSGAFRCKGYNLSVANFETGFRWGNEEGDTRIGAADSSGQTNIDDNIYNGLRTYRCGRGIIFDCSGADHNTFNQVWIEGAYTDLVAGYTCATKKWIRRNGTGNKYDNYFINISDVEVDGAGVLIENGDGIYNVFNFENPDTKVKILKINPSVARSSLIFNNWSCPSTIDEYSSSHTGGNNVAVLTDSTQSWTIDEFATTNYMVTNITDGSFGVITANTATTVTATLENGTDNDWDTNDEYRYRIDPM